jgi:arginine utilization protein RocB
MSENTPRTPAALELATDSQLIDGILEKAVQAAQRNVERFAKLAALARAIEQCNSSPAARAKLLFTFDEIASNAEADAKLDADLFEGLRNGQVLKQELRREHQQRAESFPDITLVAPSTTKH